MKAPPWDSRAANLALSFGMSTAGVVVIFTQGFTNLWALIVGVFLLAGGVSYYEPPLP